MKIKSLFSHAYNLHAWVVFIIIFLCCACSNDIKTISDFPINQKLKGRQIKALDSLYNAYSIIKLDGKYRVTSKTVWLKIYSYPFNFNNIDYLCGRYVTDGSI